jgi:hypothetical protein
VLLSASLLCAAVTLSAPAFAGEPSAADKETARGLMAEGRADRDKGDLKAALKAFAGADAIMHVPTTGLELARAQAAVGQLVEARDTALRVTRSPEQQGEPAPFKAARDAASALNDQLGGRIPSLTVNVKNVPSGMSTALTIDGIDVPSEVIGQPRKLDPGHHVVEAKAGTAYGKQEVDVAEKDSKEVTIELPAQSATGAGGATDTGATDGAQQSEQPAESGGRSGGSKVMIFGGFGLAAVGAIAGTVTGIMSMSKTNSIKSSSACTSSGGGTVCNPSEDGDISSAKTLATISTISFIAGGVGAAVGVIGLFVGGGSSSDSAPAQTPDAPADQSSRLRVHVAPWIGLGSAGLSGTF